MGTQTGGIAGVANGSQSATTKTLIIQSCYNTGIVSGKIIAGGIVGFNAYHGVTIKDCYNTAKITGQTYAGGISGNNQARIETCYNTGEIVTAISFSAGGITSYNGNVISSSIIANCYALNSKVTCNDSGNNSGIGRVVGWNVAGSMSGNYAFSTMQLYNGAVLVPVGTKGVGTKEGADITFSQATSQTHYETTCTWGFDASGPWTFTYTPGTTYVGAGTNLPILKVFIGTAMQNPILIP